MILVSACLVGDRCRYDGGAFTQFADLRRLVDEGKAIPVCPEQLGGLPTPRPPAEIVGGDGRDVLSGEARVCREDGTDVTEAFVRGAEETARIAREVGATRAILKARSPSCGSQSIHDGTFQGQTRPGVGTTVACLQALGLVIEDETSASTPNP